MKTNLALLRLIRARWQIAVNLQLDLAALYVGAVWHSERRRAPIGLAPDPKLAPPAIAVTQFDLWIHPLPVIALHFIVWRIV